MSKKSIIEREKKRSSIIKKYSSLRTELKLCLKTAINLEDKLTIYSKIQSLPRNSSQVRSF
jgi:small subunit ribosomal protein S14